MTAHSVIVADDLVFRDASDQPVTTSLVVAARFEKRHDNVLQAIERLNCSADFTGLNFQASEYTDTTGRALKQYRITRDGFTRLVFGFTGEKAAHWIEAFIAAFNAMEQQLRDNHRTVEQIIASAVEMNAQTMQRLEYAHAVTDLQVIGVRDEVRAVDQRVGIIDAKVDRLSEQVTSFAEVANQHRRQIGEPVKALHRVVLQRQGWQCPCCRTTQEPAAFEFDHFYRNSHADFAHSWPLCRQCHAGLTNNRITRGDVRSDFDAYHAFAKRELPEQHRLF
jgi:Rha family phage regulatory protein